MRAKLFAAFLSLCAVVALGAVPAAASASTVAIQDQNEEPLKESEEVGIAPHWGSILYRPAGHSSPYECQSVAIDTMEVESGNPVLFRTGWEETTPLDGSGAPCGSPWGVGGGIEFEMAVPVFNTDGSVTTELTYDVTYKGSSGENTCHVAGFVPKATWTENWNPVEADFSFSGIANVTETKQGWCPLTMELQGTFDLNRLINGEIVEASRLALVP